MMEDRELRQYFEDIYITFLGSHIKNGATRNPDDILVATMHQWRALVKAMEKEVERYQAEKQK
jgi:hypothetical protein